MANVTTHPVQAREPFVKWVFAQFTTAGTGAPTGIEGSASTVARTDVGDFTVTLKETWNDVIWVKAEIQDVATDAVVVSETVSTNGQILLTTRDGTFTAADSTGKVVQIAVAVRHTARSREA